MTINGVSGTNAQIGALGRPESNDPVAKSIERQIAETQKQLQDLAQNKELSGEDKMKKRQELQQQINDLNMQLRQHQIEKRQEKQKEQQEKSASDDIFDPNGQSNPSANAASKNMTGFSQAGMEALISADTSRKQASVQGSVADKMEGRAGVIEAEMKLDSARNGSAGNKQAELDEVNKKAQQATASQLETLAEAGKKLNDAVKAENSAKDNTAASDKDKDGESKTVADKDKDGEDKTVAGKDNDGESKSVADIETSGNNGSNEAVEEYYGPLYKTVDIRL